MRKERFIPLFIVAALFAAIIGKWGFDTVNPYLPKINTAAVGGAYWGGDEKTGISTWSQLLTLRNSTNTRDSTAVHPSHRYMTVSILPGKTTTTPDSFHSNKDSTQVDVYIRFYNDRTRNNISSSIKLFDAMCCQTTKSTNSDSMNYPINFTNVTSTAYTAGTGSWDSTRIDLADLRNMMRIKSLAPYFDVVLEDADTKVGKGSKYIVQVNYADY